MLDSSNPTSYESEQYSLAATDPLTDDYYSDSDEEFSSHHDRAEHDNSVTIKSKPKMIKKEKEDLIETNE